MRKLLASLVSVIAIAMISLLWSAGTVGGQTVTPGYRPDAVTDNMPSVRYRSFKNTGEDEIYLGVHDLGNPINRTQLDLGQEKWGYSNDITFTYDPTSDKLTTTVNTGSQNFILEYLDLSNIADPGLLANLNYMQIDVVNRGFETMVDFVNVKLNEIPLGNFISYDWQTWMVTDFDFSKGFTITGRLDLGGTFVSPDPEFSKLQIVLGYLPPTGPGVPIDIKPQSCPNPLNVNSKGVLPVAILGTDSFDVTVVDPSNVVLEGVAPLRWALEDVATPFEPFTGKEDCFEDCTTEGPDGYLDLTLKFDRQEVVTALIGVSDGDCLVLELTGLLYDGAEIIGEDMVLIRKKGKP